MKKTCSGLKVLPLLLPLLLGISFSASKSIEKDEWTSLLDKDLSQWRTYLSYEIKNGYNGSVPVDAKGDTIQPIGYDNNAKNVFTVNEESGTPILRISGEIYGCLFTKNSYKNYRFKLKMKWGNKKWEPRLDEPLDSGILYHSQGEAGVDYWRSWMLSHEFQLIEESSGDYWSIGNSQVKIPAQKEGDLLRFDPQGKLLSVGTGSENGGFCGVRKSADKPVGEWNDIELVCYEGKSLYIVNGEVVMALSNLTYTDGDVKKPLIEGAIQLQSEAGEVFFKDIKIKEIDTAPEEFSIYFKV
ncbi:DUF1080 domain-containing protein [Dysgonomonas sp. ZJ709]|uniref:3-keto-disaccharide hydrolase n=1 Tax=Dysgonomonas sp. ZJ709 TaxID=2709797 RepID=UPI0013EC05DF|nr:DUF1080 domain-containing protein [Dysgonomonas sp. ZJ709]